MELAAKAAKGQFDIGRLIGKVVTLTAVWPVVLAA
jgi:hypothetical protein